MDMEQQVGLLLSYGVCYQSDIWEQVTNYILLLSSPHKPWNGHLEGLGKLHKVKLEVNGRPAI